MLKIPIKVPHLFTHRIHKLIIVCWTLYLHSNLLENMSPLTPSILLSLLLMVLQPALSGNLSPTTIEIEKELLEAAHLKRRVMQPPKISQLPFKTFSILTLKSEAITVDLVSGMEWPAST